ncbi:hypothetical protein C8J56DRAFT_1053839 [Mycena floridula]|nr:hypothetical protein C8J56DRAFT_1053839 [Mycena floridula]
MSCVQATTSARVPPCCFGWNILDDKQREERPSIRAVYLPGRIEPLARAPIPFWKSPRPRSAFSPRRGTRTHSPTFLVLHSSASTFLPAEMSSQHPVYGDWYLNGTERSVHHTGFGTGCLPSAARSHGLNLSAYRAPQYKMIMSPTLCFRHHYMTCNDA